MHSAAARMIGNVRLVYPMLNRNCVFEAICGEKEALYTVPLYSPYPIQKLRTSSGFPFVTGAQGTVSVSTLFEVIYVMAAFRMISLSIEKFDTVAVNTPLGALTLQDHTY